MQLYEQAYKINLLKELEIKKEIDKRKKIEKSKNIFITEHGLQNKFIVQYSGNIGVTHNVETLVEIAELLKANTEIIFQIIGRGPRKSKLENLVKKKNLSNCVFLPFQTDAMFPYSLSAADVGVVILDETTSKGSVPSKSYNLMSYGIPSLYIASKDSQLYEYTKKYEHGACFSKNELKVVTEFLKNLSTNSLFYNEISSNAIKAAKNFKRENADKFIKAYTV
jgi:glycosyltransferase involved in cell wall biosynthesis